MTLARSLSIGLALLCSPSLALATTYVVDDGGGAGVDFTDIPPAIAAAAPGDVLLIQPGSYSGFTLGKPLVLIGYGVASVAGPMELQDISGPLTTAIVGLHGEQLDVLRCSGTVLVQETLDLQRCALRDDADVRMRTVSARPPAGPPQAAVSCGNTRLEGVSVDFWGSDAPQNPPCPPQHPNDGGSGLACADGSRVFLTRANLHGGAGATITCQGAWAGGGGSGLLLVPQSRSFVCDSTVSNGASGFNFYYDDCSHDGCSGGPISGFGALMRLSNVVFGGETTCWFGVQCIPSPIAPYPGCCPTIPAVPDPRLEVAGQPAPSQPLTFTVYAPSGAAVELLLGREPATTPLPGFVVEQLVAHPRIVNLGTVPVGASSLAYALPLAGSLAPGELFFAQARVTLSGSGETRHTNSAPIVIR